ncbi:glycosyltransferase family 2 protein [Epilithonimonas sp.]|uniref:glycosyltransferase family 2 protein n=1 Tax=Epilithonimonas sp. TaxID=2894511 RepID=UPI0028AC6102|nr:glycosyltransferase family 2 protein [Epilithonimonas sp.]
MKEPIQISIIIPVYNREKMVLETLKSILHQTSSSWECIIVDDYSTDNTDQVIAQFLNENASFRFQYFKNERAKGAQGARNTGISHAKAEYLMFLDSDDMIADYCVENRVLCTVKNPNFDFYCFPTLIFESLPFDKMILWNYLTKQENDIARFLNVDTPWQTGGVLWKKDVIEKLGGWDEKLSCWQDWDMHVRAIISPNIKYYKADNNYIDNFYRKDLSEDAISKKELEKKSIDSKIYLTDKTIQMFIDLGLVKDYRVFFLKLIHRHLSQYTTITSSDKSAHLLKTFLSKLGFNRFFVDSWYLYFRYRFDEKKPRLMRKVLDIVPRLYKKESLLNYIIPRTYQNSVLPKEDVVVKFATEL